jgi:TPR repeat protein
VKLFLRAAEQGSAEGQAGLGYCYGSGRGVKQDYGRAATWFVKAADQDEAAAQSNLGFLYEHGLGVKLDYIEAYKWLALAAGHGDSPSQQELRRLEKIMTTRQVERAHSRILAWKPATLDAEPGLGLEAVLINEQ